MEKKKCTPTEIFFFSIYTKFYSQKSEWDIGQQPISALSLKQGQVYTHYISIILII